MPFRTLSWLVCYVVISFFCCPQWQQYLVSNRTISFRTSGRTVLGLCRGCLWGSVSSPEPFWLSGQLSTMILPVSCWNEPETQGYCCVLLPSLLPLRYDLIVTTQLLSAIHSYPGVSGRDSAKCLSCSSSHTRLQCPLEISRIAGALLCQPSSRCWGDQSPHANLWPQRFI